MRPMCIFWLPRGSFLIPAPQAIKLFRLQYIFDISTCLALIIVLFIFLRGTGSSTPLSLMAESSLDVKQNVRGGLVPVITLGLWVGLDNVSLW